MALYPDFNSPRNYPEDYKDGENQYQNTCDTCGEEFFGHKYRYTCKVCLHKIMEALGEAEEEGANTI